MRASLVVLLAAAGSVLSACGGGDSGTAVTSTDTPPRVLPACARGGPAVAPPPSFPSDFPLPPGTVVSSAESPHVGQLVVRGAIPADLDEAAGFFSGVLPEHGYRVGVGDAEGTESEAPFTGQGYRGKWRVNSIPDCPAVKLTLVLIEQ